MHDHETRHHHELHQFLELTWRQGLGLVSFFIHHLAQPATYVLAFQMKAYVEMRTSTHHRFIVVVDLDWTGR